MTLEHSLTDENPAGATRDAPVSSPHSVSLYHYIVSAKSSSVAALLLTGGSSRRMGHDKTQLLLDGETLALRTARLLSRVVTTAVEVGPGVSGLTVVLEQPRGGGPLVAVAAGRTKLRSIGHEGAALVIACDLPFVSEALLRLLVEWDSVGSVVPIVDGLAQPLCAKWGPDDLDSARDLADRGVRSIRHLSHQPGATLLDQSVWGRVASDRDFADVDSPDDVHSLGLQLNFAPTTDV
jgi:molybdopterin-guanine dinucleotide biosynthesis protein A